MARKTPPLEPVASIVQRLAVLLSAGVAPGSAWGYLAESQSGPIGQRLSAIAARSAGGPIAEAILSELPAPEDSRAHRSAPASDTTAWRGLAAAWLVATDAGASLAPSLRDFAESLRDLARTQRELGVALAGPAATAKMVMVLPLVGVLFGLALGFDTLGVLFTTVPGGICLVLGVALMLAARSWNRRLLRAAAPGDLTPGLHLELLAIAVSGGASIDRARQAVAEAREHCDLPDSDDGTAVDEVLDLSRRAGVPAAALLRSEAEQTRRAARSDAEEKAATLTVTLMLPLGLCVLPAFMLLGVAPLMIAVISSTALSF